MTTTASALEEIRKLRATVPQNILRELDKWYPPLPEELTWEEQKRQIHEDEQA